jgi:membrane protein required for colicin V production
MAYLNYLDCAFLLFLLISVLLGVKRGFLKETVALVAWCTAFILATRYYLSLTDYILHYYASSNKVVNSQDLQFVINVASYLVLFAASLISGSVLAMLVGLLDHNSGFMYRAMGGLTGCCVGLIIISYITFFASYTVFIESSLWVNSKVVLYVKPLVNCLRSVANPYIKSNTTTKVNINKNNDRIATSDK